MLEWPPEALVLLASSFLVEPPVATVTSLDSVSTALLVVVLSVSLRIGADVVIFSESAPDTQSLSSKSCCAVQRGRLYR